MLEIHLDISGLEQHSKDFRAGLPRTVAAHMQKLPEEIRRSVLSFTSEATTPEGAFSAESKLGVRSGGLRDALTKGKPGNLSALSVRQGYVESSFGLTEEAQIRYGIHDTGGEIGPTERMRRFFMARYIETGLPSWLYMSLHVAKGLAITIPKRPWWTPGIEKAIVNMERTMPPAVRGAVSKLWEMTGNG